MKQNVNGGNEMTTPMENRVGHGNFSRILGSTRSEIPQGQALFSRVC